MMVLRKTATKYLDKIVNVGLLHKVKVGKTNYYMNTELMDIFINRAEVVADIDTVESVS